METGRAGSLLCHRARAPKPELSILFMETPRERYKGFLEPWCQVVPHLVLFLAMKVAQSVFSIPVGTSEILQEHKKCVPLRVGSGALCSVNPAP